MAKRTIMDSFKLMEKNLIKREVFEISEDSLPAASTGNDPLISCDTCTRKGVNDEPAVIYCNTCCKKYCVKHQQLHDELNDDHPRIGIDEYRTKARKLDVRMCVEHKDQPYFTGCKVCLTVFCVKCLSGLGSCSNGAFHQLISIDELLSDLLKQIDDLKVKMMNQEGELSSLLKTTSKSLSDYEIMTEQMIQFIQKARDEQVSDIIAKYDALEAQLIKQRKQNQTKMTQFLEQTLDTELSQLSKHRLRIDAQLKHSHQVDVINGYRDTKDEINRLINAEMPKLHLKNVKVDRTGYQNRNIELRIVSAGDMNIVGKSSNVGADSQASELSESNILETWKAPLDRYVEFQVQPGSVEYQTVETAFRRGDPQYGEHPDYQRRGSALWELRIIEIKRIQNPAHYGKYLLWRNYTAKSLGKQEDEVETTGLLHDVDGRTVSNATKNGVFTRNRQFQRGFGDGIYFTKYPNNGSGGQKHTILARVVTGELYMAQQLNRGITNQHASVVDMLETPTEYGVYEDAAVYPEYVIRYQLL